jgi:ABC-type transport system substrate-binding protein
LYDPAGPEIPAWIGDFMLRRSLIPLLLLGILLGACQSNAPASLPPTAQVVTPSPQKADTAKLAASAVPSTANPAAAASSAGAVTGAPPGCTVVSPQPTPGPTETSLFPPISDKDWVIGVPTATVSIIEYSDFQ